MHGRPLSDQAGIGAMKERVGRGERRLERMTVQCQQSALFLIPPHVGNSKASTGSARSKDATRGPWHRY